MNGIIEFMFFLAMLLCIHKITFYLNQWFLYKLGKEKTQKTWLAIGIFSLIPLFLFGFQLIGFILIASTIAMFGLKRVFDFNTVRYYMYCYCLSKSGKVSKAEENKCKETMDNIWEMSQPKIKAAITKAIEKENREYQEYLEQHKGEANE